MPRKVQRRTDANKVTPVLNILYEATAKNKHSQVHEDMQCGHNTCQVGYVLMP